MSFSRTVSMFFIMPVAVLFVYFLISLEHRDDMRHGGVAERGEIEMHDHKGAEEDPESDMDENHNLDSAEEIYAEAEQIGIPDKKAGKQLQGDQQNHDRKV